MQALILTIHILACTVLVVVVLLQAGKEGMGVIFGGGSSSLFGSTGAGGFLTKLTAGVGAVFLITSLGYNVAIMGPRSTGSAMDNVQVEVPAEEQKPQVLFEEPAQPATQEQATAEEAPLTNAMQQDTSSEPVETGETPSETPAQAPADAQPEQGQQQ